MKRIKLLLIVTIVFSLTACNNPTNQLNRCIDNIVSSESSDGCEADKREELLQDYITDVFTKTFPDTAVDIDVLQPLEYVEGRGETDASIQFSTTIATLPLTLFEDNRLQLEDMLLDIIDFLQESSDVQIRGGIEVYFDNDAIVFSVITGENNTGFEIDMITMTDSMTALNDYQPMIEDWDANTDIAGYIIRMITQPHLIYLLVDKEQPTYDVTVEPLPGQTGPPTASEVEIELLSILHDLGYATN